MVDEKIEKSALEEEARKIIGFRKQQRIRLGEILIRLKKIVGHGRWEPYLAEQFAPLGLSLRTARRYMELAEQAGATANSDRLAVLEIGTDTHAQSINNATEEAQVAAEDAAEPPYRLALNLAPEFKKAIIQLWASPHRSDTESSVVSLLLRDCIKRGFLEEPVRFRRVA